ncbi:MAG: VTT domain-containing protein [Planctomycetota bacterium]
MGNLGAMRSCPGAPPDHTVLDFAVSDWLADLLAELRAAGGWLPVALFLGTFASEDLTCIAAGILAAEGTLSFPAAAIACTLGIYVSDLLLYLVGALGARGLLRWRRLRDRLAEVDATVWRRRLDRLGPHFLFATRFLPGSRLPAYVTAGAIGFPFGRFAWLLLLAAALWTPTLVAIAMASGAIVSEWLREYGPLAWLAVPVMLVVGWIATSVLGSLTTWRGRRLAIGRWRRWSRFEYWPTWLVYLPVAVTLIFLAVRYRRVAVFTACNPGIPFGGLVLESKGEILAQLDRSSHPNVAVAEFRRLAESLPLEDKLAFASDWLAADGRVVLKPDLGERGAGVAIVTDSAEALAWLRRCPGDAIVQRYVDGEEFGVGWRRRPDGRGEVHSIVHKVPPRLLGDGEHTLEELILADPREVAMAGFHLRQQAARLEWIPAAGETVRLGQLGTHCRGAKFVDARAHATPDLERSLDEFLRDVDGLDFGRFDLRVPSTTDLREGRRLSILEFNGVTGEPAHIYHPGYPFWRGMVDLCRHWIAACARGAHNHRRGVPTASATAILRLLRQARGRPAFEAARPGPVRES